MSGAIGYTTAAEVERLREGKTAVVQGAAAAESVPVFLEEPSRTARDAIGAGAGVKALEALRLSVVYEAMPTDRGGSFGPKGRARAAFIDARDAALSPVEEADTSQASCERCQGNGEIVTDWDRYRHPREGDVGDEAVAECPDCSGEGTHTAAGAGPADEDVARDFAQLPDGWLAIEMKAAEQEIAKWPAGLRSSFESLFRTARPVEKPGEVVAWQCRSRPWAGSGDGTAKWSDWMPGHSDTYAKTEPKDWQNRPLYARPDEEPGEVERDEGERAAIDKLGEATALRRELAEARGLIRDAIGLVPLAHQNWHTDARAALGDAQEAGR